MVDPVIHPARRRGLKYLQLRNLDAGLRRKGSWVWGGSFKSKQQLEKSRSSEEQQGSSLLPGITLAGALQSAKCQRRCARVNARLSKLRGFRS